MRKKISALCFLLVAMMCMSVANAQYTYKWEVLTGTDAEGAEVWTEVADPLGAGITVQSLSKMRVTVDGATKVTTNWSKYVYLYQSDLETKQFTNSITGKVSGTTVTFDVANVYSTPDKPFTVEGTYCLIIPEEGLNLTDAEGNATKSDSALGCMVTVDNDYFITKDNCGIDRTETWFKSFPTQFTITINDDRVTKTALTDKATVAVYSGKTLKTNADVVISEDGKTLTLNLQNEVTGTGSSFYVTILEGSLMFNDDATKTNNHLMFGPYTLPSSTSPRDIIPAKGGKISVIDKFYIYAGIKSGTFIFDEEKPAYISMLNETSGEYEKVCDLKAVQVEDPMSVIGQEYITIEYSPATTPEGGFALGQYQLVIPEKSWFYERPGTPPSYSYTKAYTADYELALAPEIDTTPVWSIENGSTQKDFETLTVTFAGATTAKYNSSKPAQLHKKIGSNYSHLANVSYEGISSSSYAPVGEGGVVTMKFDKLSEEGEYKIVLPEGGLTFDEFPTIANKASEITFSIESAALVKPSNVTISPAAGTISALPETFTITLGNTEVTSVEVGTQQVNVGWDENWDPIYEQQPLKATFNEVDGWGSAEYTITVDATDCKKITFTKTAESTMQLDATKQYFFQVPNGALIINKNAETGEYTVNDELNFGSYYPDYVYRWEVQTGTNEDGTEVWTEVADPLGAGATSPYLQKIRLTVDGANTLKTTWDCYAYLYESDLETKVFGNGAGKTITGNQIVFDVNSCYYTPDKPFTTEGQYWLLIPANKLQVYRTAEDVTNKVYTSNDAAMGVFVTVDNDFLVSREDCSINVEENTWYKQMPAEFVITINNDQVTKAALAANASVQLYAGSSTKTDCTVEISEDGKTLTVKPVTEMTKSGDYKIYITANSLQFNDDASKTNNHLVFGPFTLPGSASVNEIIPEAGGKITKMDKFLFSLRKTNGTFIFNDEVPMVLSRYNDETAAYEPVCNLVGTQIEGYNYVTTELVPVEIPEGGFPLGKYEVSVPEKAMFLESISSQGALSVSYNKAYTAEYELCEAPAIALSPVWSIEEGGTYEGLTEVYVTFEGATSADYNSMNPIQVYKNVAGEYVYYTDAECAEFDYNTYQYVVNVEEGGKIKLTFRDALTQEAEYKIDFSADALAFNGFTDVVNTASTISFDITSNAPIKASNTTIDPAAGGISGFPETFTMTIDNADITAVEVGMVEEYDYSIWDYVSVPAKARFMSTDYYVEVSYDITVDADDCKKIIFTKSADSYAQFDDTKQYYFQVPAGALVVNKNAETGEFTQNDEINFGLYEKFAVEVTPSVDDVLYSVKDFVITANTPVLTYVANEENPVMINYIDPEFGMISPMTATVNAVEGVANQFVLSLEMEAKQPGEYTLYVPAGTFLYNGDENLPVEEISNVYEVIAEPIDEGVTTVPAQGDLDINMVGGTFRSVNVMFPEDVMRNPDFKGEITLAINGTIVSSVEKLSAGELPTELGIIFPDKFTLNGTYTVTMPRGAALYVADGRESSSQVFTWNVTGGFTPGEGVTVNPEEGEVESLSVITLTFNEHEIAGKNIWYNGSALAANGNVTLRDASGSIVAECTVSEMSPSEAGYNSVEIKLCEVGTSNAIEITKPGEYTLTVPEGIVNFNKNGANPCTCGECSSCTTSRTGTGNGNYNEELTFTWTIPGDATLVATPADGSVVESLINIQLEWQDAGSVTVDTNLMIGGAKLYKVVEGTENEFVSDMICSPIGEGGTTAVIDIMNPISENGVYVVEIAEGMFTVDGKAWEAVTLTYTIARAEVTLEETGDAPLAKFLMTVSPCESIEVNPETADVITLWYTTSGEQRMGEYTVENITASTAELVLQEGVELKDGDYVVWIPEGYFLFDGKPCADFKVFFEDVIIDSIYGISLDAQNLNIYSVNGMLIKRNGSITDLNELEPGIYIINGKKVMVK